MFYSDIPERPIAEDPEEVETFSDNPRGDNYYSDVGNTSNYSFMSPQVEEGLAHAVEPLPELVRYFLARGMRPEQAIESTRRLMSPSKEKTAQLNEDEEPGLVDKLVGEADLSSRLFGGATGAALGTLSSALYRPSSPRRLLAGALLGGTAGALTPGNPGLGLGLGAASFAGLRSASAGNLLRHIKPDRLSKAHQTLNSAIQRSGINNKQIRALNRAADSERNIGRVKDVIDSFIRQQEGGYKAKDILSDAGNPTLTSMFSRFLPQSMGGIRNVRLTPTTPNTGVKALLNTADDIQGVNLGGLEAGSLQQLKDISNRLEGMMGMGIYGPNHVLTAGRTLTGNPNNMARALSAAQAIQKARPEIAKHIVEASGRADRAAAHIMSPIVYGLGGSLLGEASSHLLGANKAYGTSSATRDALNAVAGDVPSNIAENTGMSALRKHFNDNYGKYLTGAALLTPAAMYLYNTPTREELRTRGRI